MNASRRDALFGALSVGGAALFPNVSPAQSGRRVPDPTTFQSGDFLWPKQPGAFIPYDYRQDDDVDLDRERWNREKEAFLARAKASGDPELIRIANEVEPLTYNEFRALYLRDQTPGQITPYSFAGVIAVGHVAIIEVDDANHPWVIDALWKPGVVRTPYAAWLQGRPKDIVWHGRLKGFAPEKRSSIASEAGTYVGKPYDFWNLNLADTAGFYCSKLVWLSIMRALKFPVDDNPNPARRIWLSPKQILNSRNITLMLNPGDYGSE